MNDPTKPVGIKPPRIVWTAAEHAAFLEAARTFGPPENGDTHEVWHRAQEVAGLPPARRRPFDPATAVKMNAARRQGRIAEAQVKKIETPQPAPIVEDTSKPLFDVAKQAAQEAPPAPQATSLSALAADLIKDTVLRVLYDVEVRTALRSLIAETLAPEKELQKIEGVTWRDLKVPLQERNKRIVIVGADKHTDSMYEIAGIDIRLFSTRNNESEHRLRNLIKNADAAVLITSHISHSMYDMVRAAKHLKLLHWNRGVNELKPVLEEFAKTLNG